MTDTSVARTVEGRTHWVLPIVAGFVTYCLAVAAAVFLSLQFQNHDTAVLVLIVFGLLGGVITARVGTIVWLWRNP
jgi:uncharacterized membrane protein